MQRTGVSQLHVALRLTFVTDPCDTRAPAGQSSEMGGILELVKVVDNVSDRVWTGHEVNSELSACQGQRQTKQNDKEWILPHQRACWTTPDFASASDSFQYYLNPLPRPQYLADKDNLSYSNPYQKPTLRVLVYHLKMPKNKGKVSLLRSQPGGALTLFLQRS